MIQWSSWGRRVRSAHQSIYCSCQLCMTQSGTSISSVFIKSIHMGGGINIHSMVRITKITCDNDSCIHNPDSESGIYMAVVVVDGCCVVVKNLEEEIRGKIKGSMSKCGKKRLTESPSKEGTFIIYFPWYPTSRETPRPLRTPLTLYSKTPPTYPPTPSRTYSFTWGGVLVSYPTLRRRRLQCISCIYGVKYYVIGSRHHWWGRVWIKVAIDCLLDG